MATVCLTQAQTARPVFPGQRPTQPPVTATPQVGAPQVPGAPVTAPAGSQPPQPTPRPAESIMGPAVPPVVTYRDGLLTVQALNSNLSSVVTAIRNKTGIEFEGAENITERVALSLGPAPEGDVLAAIFSGSHYDFVALGRPDSPSIVQRVILTVKNIPGAPGAPAGAQAQPRPAQQGEGEEEEVPDEQPNAGGDPQDTPVQPPQIPQQPPQQENQQPQQPKTPEQLLQELQQMQQNQKAPPDPQNPNNAPRKLPPRAF